jgi:PEP-CTERM motif
MRTEFANHGKKSMKTKLRGLNLCGIMTMLLLCCAVASCPGQNTLQITFDGPPVQLPGTSRIVTNYNEAGISFTAIPLSRGFVRNNAANSLYPDDGSAYIQGGPDTLTFNFTDGSKFGLISVDLAEYSTVFQEPLTLEFIGYHPDGSTVTESFTTDGIIDGTGPLADFQTFDFTGFTDLTRVEIPVPSGSDYSLDNLVVSVPEPASGILLLMGGGLVLGGRKLRRLRG